MTAQLTASLGELCVIRDAHGRRFKAEVIAVEGPYARLMTFEHAAGLAPGLPVMGTGQFVQIPVGTGLLGRTLNGLGQTIDGLGPLSVRKWRNTHEICPSPLDRPTIHEPLITGQRAIDGLLTIGKGQRIGLFAGSGVGKSTLLGEIAKNADADLNVIVLVGERGREVKPFLTDCLGPDGCSKSVVIVATSDESSLMKVQAVQSGVTIAEQFRRNGHNVLFFLDSLTRYASALKEIGLARGETPGVRGYPSSVQSEMATTLERLGSDENGTITGLITVLVDGDDMMEPIADSARSILDGHIVLDRRLASLGHFPAIDPLNSLSRLFREVTSADHQRSAQRIRKLLATYEEVAELIQVGLYQSGTSSEVDEAILLRPKIRNFLQQSIGELSPIKETLRRLQAL